MRAKVEDYCCFSIPHLDRLLYKKSQNSFHNCAELIIIKNTNIKGWASRYHSTTTFSASTILPLHAMRRNIHHDNHQNKEIMGSWQTTFYFTLYDRWHSAFFVIQKYQLRGIYFLKMFNIIMGIWKVVMIGMDMGQTYWQMVASMRESSKITRSMDVGRSHGQTVTSTRESG